MALREYKCACRYTTELLLPTTQEPPTSTPCKNCGGDAYWVQFSRTGLITSTFQNNPIDIQVGADSEKKWQTYHDRQEERNKVRQETGSFALTELDGGFIPTPDRVKELREVAATVRSKETSNMEETYYRSEVEKPSVD